MTRLRVRIAKEGLARFLSHLDFQQTLARALRRSQLPVAYSQGFNPHPRYSFAAALPTGYASEGEYLDVELREPVEPSEFGSRLGQALPAGLRVVEVREAPAGGTALMAAINTATYWVRFAVPHPEPEREAAAAIAAFLARASVEIERTGREGRVQSLNIRPLVHALSPAPDEPHRGGPSAAALGMPGQGALRAVLAAGQQGNLRPEDLLTGLGQVHEPLAGARALMVVRLGLYQRRTGGILVEPWEL